MWKVIGTLFCTILLFLIASASYIYYSKDFNLIHVFSGGRFPSKAKITLASPEGRKIFTAIDEYKGGKYQYTSGFIIWGYEGGGSIFYYNKEHSQISAEWHDSNQLRIMVEEDVKFFKKRETQFFNGDEVTVDYRHR